MTIVLWWMWIILVVIKTSFDLKGAHTCQNHQYEKHMGIPTKVLHYLVPFSMAGMCRLEFGWRCVLVEKVVEGFVARACVVTGLRINHGHPSLGCQSGAVMRTAFKRFYALFFKCSFSGAVGGTQHIDEVCRVNPTFMFPGETLVRMVKQWCGWRKVCPVTRVIANSYPS